MDPMVIDGVSWTNRDVAAVFYDMWKNTGIKLGAGFTLPDVGQVYEVVEVRFVKIKGKPVPLLVLEAECAVEGCRHAFQTTRQPFEFAEMSGIVRTCDIHRRQWKSPCAHAWMEGTARDRKLRKVSKPFVPGQQIGVTQQIVLDVLAMSDVLGDMDRDGLCRAAAGHIGGRSTPSQRFYSAARALAGLEQRGLVSFRDGIAHRVC